MTARELQVAQLMALGLRDLEIAAELGISVRSVKARKRRAAWRIRNSGKRLDILLIHAVCGNVVSESQLQVLAPRLRNPARLAALGLTNLEIGARLGLAENTVRGYMKEAYDVAGVWNRRELAGLLLGGGRETPGATGAEASAKKTPTSESDSHSIGRSVAIPR